MCPIFRNVLQEELYKCIDTILYDPYHMSALDGNPLIGPCQDW